MKVAISIPDDLFREIERIADERNVSRSQVFAEAARDYIRRSETRRLVDKLNEVYSVPETQEEAAGREAMAAYQRRRVTRNKP